MVVTLVYDSLFDALSCSTYESSMHHARNFWFTLESYFKKLIVFCYGIAVIIVRVKFNTFRQYRGLSIRQDSTCSKQMAFLFERWNYASEWERLRFPKSYWWWRVVNNNKMVLLVTQATIHEQSFVALFDLTDRWNFICGCHIIHMQIH